MIGDQLTTDIHFGNLNEMATVWVNEFWKDKEAVEYRVEKLWEIEQSYAKFVLKNKTPKIHKDLKVNL